MGVSRIMHYSVSATVDSKNARIQTLHRHVSHCTAGLLGFSGSTVFTRVRAQSRTCSYLFVFECRVRGPMDGPMDEPITFLAFACFAFPLKGLRSSLPVTESVRARCDYTLL